MSEGLPEGWSRVEFGELAESIKSGLSRRIVAQDIGLPVLISGNIQNNKLDVSELKFWYADDPQGADTSRYILNDGDILLCFINSISQIGKVCVFRNIGRPSIYTTNLFRIVVSSSFCSRFVYHYMTYGDFQREIQLITKPAVNQASFTKGDLEGIFFFTPPLPEQKKIAAILSSVDEVIEKTQAQIDKLKDLKTGMMQELLSPREGSRQSELMGYHEFKDSPVGRIPVGWEVSTLGRAFSLTSGGTPSRGKAEYFSTSHDSIPWVKTLDLNDGVICQTDERITDKAIECSTCKLLPVGSALIAMYGGWNQIGRTGVLGVIAATNQAICALKFNGEVLGYFVRYWLTLKRPLWKSVAASSRKDPNITKQDVSDFFVAYPSLSEQEEIIKKVDSISDFISSKETCLVKYSEIKKALMQDLLTGKVRTTHLLDKDL